MSDETETPIIDAGDTLESAMTTGDEVNVVANKLEAVLVGHNRQAAIAALIALAVLNLRPDFTGDSLGEAITHISKEICLLDVIDAQVTEVTN